MGGPFWHAGRGPSRGGEAASSPWRAAACGDGGPAARPPLHAQGRGVPALRRGPAPVPARHPCITCLPPPRAPLPCEPLGLTSSALFRRNRRPMLRTSTATAVLTLAAGFLPAAQATIHDHTGSSAESYGQVCDVVGDTDA